MTNPDLETYYRRRAEEYDAVYRKPERQADIARLAELVASKVEGRRVLEVAAGTGYWTAHASTTAVSVLATDVAEETLRIARRRRYGPGAVAFKVSDAYELDHLDGSYDAGLACFWLSHVRRDDMRRFLRHLEARLEVGGIVVLADNRYVEGSNHPITRTDAHGNTYQRRQLASGEEYEILKNFLDANELTRLAGDTCAEVIELEYYWLLAYDRPREARLEV